MHNINDCPITNDFIIVIPARFSSTRLPEKMLADIEGKPMIVRVYEQALKTRAKQIIVATDDLRIKDALTAVGADVVMTDIAHPSGTVRIAEAIKIKNVAPETIIVNVQGDLPLVSPKLIEQLAEDQQQYPQAQISTLVEPFKLKEQLINPNLVKVVLDKNQNAIYFSRSPIPWQKSFSDEHVPLEQVYHHIGLYAYRAAYVCELAQLEPSPLESLENLEQLRALWHGHTIHVALACDESVPGVDTLADLQYVRQLFVAH